MGLLASGGLEAMVQAACANAFAEPVTYLPATGAPVPTRGIFEGASRDLEVRDGDEVEVSRPRLGLSRLDLPAGVTPSPGELFIIQGATWRIIGVDDDRQGFLRLSFYATPV